MKTIYAVVALVAFAAGGVVGAFGGSRIATKAAQASVVPCPACNCPPTAAIDLGQLDFGKIVNKKGQMDFKIDQRFENVTLILTDSTTYKKAIEACK